MDWGPNSKELNAQERGLNIHWKERPISMSRCNQIEGNPTGCGIPKKVNTTVNRRQGAPQKTTQR